MADREDEKEPGELRVHRDFIAAYARRPDFANMIFVITGDHRLIPIPPASRLDRYRVPFLIYSPMVKAPRIFPSVSSHLNKNSLALMRTKNSLDEYLGGMTFVSESESFRIDEQLGLTPAGDPVARAVARDRLQAFRALKLNKLTPTEVFEVARRHAHSDDYPGAPLITRRLLRDNPGFHDARALLGRTYAWDRKFDEARTILEGLVERAPEYYDGHLALIDVERWSDSNARALARATAAARLFPRNAEVLASQSRMLQMVGKNREAKDVLDRISKLDPTNADAAKLRARLAE